MIKEKMSDNIKIKSNLSFILNSEIGVLIYVFLLNLFIYVHYTFIL